MDPVPPNLPLLTGSYKNQLLDFLRFGSPLVLGTSKSSIPTLVNENLHLSAKLATFLPEHADKVLYLAGANFYLYLT